MLYRFRRLQPQVIRAWCARNLHTFFWSSEFRFPWVRSICSMPLMASGLFPGMCGSVRDAVVGERRCIVSVLGWRGCVGRVRLCTHRHYARKRGVLPSLTVFGLFLWVLSMSRDFGRSCGFCAVSGDSDGLRCRVSRQKAWWGFAVCLWNVCSYLWIRVLSRACLCCEHEHGCAVTCGTPR